MVIWLFWVLGHHLFLFAVCSRADSWGQESRLQFSKFRERQQSGFQALKATISWLLKQKEHSHIDSRANLWRQNGRTNSQIWLNNKQINIVLPQKPAEMLLCYAMHRLMHVSHVLTPGLGKVMHSNGNKRAHALQPDYCLYITCERCMCSSWLQIDC